MQASTKPLRVGIIGAGWVSRYHFRAWQRQSPEAVVVAVADPSGTNLSERAAEFGVESTFVDARSLVAGASPDVLDICTPREFHADLVRFAAACGLPAICQKPLACSLADAERLVADVGDRIPLMVHENWRFRKYYRRIAELQRREAIGELRHVRLDFLSSGMIADADGKRPALVRQPFLKTLDRMLIMEILIHHLDTLRFLLGEMEVRSARLFRSNDAIIGEDGAIVVLERREDGLPVHIVSSLAVHGEPPLPTDRLRVIGTEGMIVLNGARLEVTGCLASVETFDPDETYQGAYDAAIAHFVDGLRGDKAFETAPSDNLKTLAIVEAIYAAASAQGVRTEGGSS